MIIIASVIKVESDQITLEDDATGETHVIPLSAFPVLEQGIQMGQIFEWNQENGAIRYNEKETESRRQKVAGLLAKLHRV